MILKRILIAIFRQDQPTPCQTLVGTSGNPLLLVELLLRLDEVGHVHHRRVYDS